MIDFHSHILPGIDDGPANIDESVAMAAALSKAGFKTIYCTPHLIKGCFDADNHAVLSAVETLQTRLNAEKIKVEILPGREYYLDEFLSTYLKDPLPLGGTKYIMIEIPQNTPAEYIKETFFRIKCGGFIPIIAHPERCSHFAIPQGKKSLWSRFYNLKQKNGDSKQGEQSLLDYLKDIGCAFQANMGSFVGWYGPEVQQTAFRLKEKKVITHYGTDAHSLNAITRLNLEP